MARPDLLSQLERRSVSLDPSISRLSPREVLRSRTLRSLVTADLTEAAQLLAYGATAESHDGQARLVAVFESNPFASADPILNEAMLLRGWMPDSEPRVFALDGPTRSPHRQPEALHPRPTEGGCRELCLYYDRDPVERRWRSSLGLLGLFDIARRHLEAEFFWRLGHGWLLPEAPHGRGKPAKRDPKKLIRPADVFRDAA